MSTGYVSQGHWSAEGSTLSSSFFADAVGHHAPCRRHERGYFEAYYPAPSSDPAVLAGAIAYVTSHLGIAFTASILQEHPFNFARRISALDHVSKGRAAWNIIADGPPTAWAEEYVDVTYKLWEGSWEEDALRQAGRAGGRAGDGKVHRINHWGPRYKVEGPHLASPSPQRTPLLFQAGASEADRAFAARNAEAVFIRSPNLAAVCCSSLTRIAVGVACPARSHRKARPSTCAATTLTHTVAPSVFREFRSSDVEAGTRDGSVGPVRCSQADEPKMAVEVAV